MKFFNNIVSAFVVAIIFLLIIPLPTWLLDFMFITNLTLSFVILLTTMYIKDDFGLSVPATDYHTVSPGPERVLHP